jgi:hypothetical protein
VVKKLSHLPIVADPSHGAGRRDMVAPMARAAVAAGADGLIIEVHNDPDRAWSDGAQSMFPGAVRPRDGGTAHHRARHRPQHLPRAGVAARLVQVAGHPPLMPAASAPPFERVVIAGVGLIGGSIALRHSDDVGRRSESSASIDRRCSPHATGAGAIERGFERLDQIPVSDLVVLAAPVRQNVKLLGELARLDSSALITDAGGTKREIVKAASALGVASRFVGGHPIGGAERGGFGFAHPELFAGRPWIFTT